MTFVPDRQTAPICYIQIIFIMIRPWQQPRQGSGLHAEPSRPILLSQTFYDICHIIRVRKTTLIDGVAKNWMGLDHRMGWGIDHLTVLIIIGTCLHLGSSWQGPALHPATPLWSRHRSLGSVPWSQRRLGRWPGGWAAWSPSSPDPPGPASHNPAPFGGLPYSEDGSLPEMRRCCQQVCEGCHNF